MSTLKFPAPVQPVPLFDAKIQYKGLKVHLEEAVRRVLDSGCAIGGKELKGFEQEFANFCGAACAVACASGTDAISLALKALDVGPGDEVITTPFTFFATASCVARLGATPVFVDIDPYTFNINPALIEAKITPRTKAIMPVHLFGQCADMEPIWHIAEKHDIPVIEDAAQSTGSEYQGKRCGTLGAMACFSFYPTKNLGTYGDGGMVVTNDREWARKLVGLRNHGMYTRYYHEEMGWNSRLDAIQAAMLRVKLPHLNLWNSARQQIASRYDHLLEEQHLTGFLTRPTIRTYGKHCFNQYVVRVADGQRDALRKHLAEESVGTEIYYPLPLHLQKVFSYLGYQPGDFPVTEKACKEVLALPMFPELTLEQQRKVVQSCLGYLVKERGLRQAA
ncbi:MAG TPA: DegT/DnrJ/EryC1/StrS family aminotransferase [Gemmatales bacterium]|nr:DegT/DnrJ/EryC1/StrS family aminotransferase [Gemmatales bacterium]